MIAYPPKFPAPATLSLTVLFVRIKGPELKTPAPLPPLPPVAPLLCPELTPPVPPLPV